MSVPGSSDTPGKGFWRELPCGHPQDPVAWQSPDGHYCCHCGWILDIADAISDGQREDAPGPIVPCGKCGCFVAIPLPGSLDERDTREQELLEEIADAAELYFATLYEHHWRCENRTAAKGWKKGDPPIIECVCGLERLEKACAELNRIRK